MLSSTATSTLPICLVSKTPVVGSNVPLGYPGATVCPLLFLSSRAFLNSSPPVTPSTLIQSCSGPLFLWPSSASWGAVNSHVTVSLTATYTSPVRTLPSSRILSVHNTWKSASRSLRPTHSGKLQLSPSPVLSPTSVPWPRQEISSSKHLTAPRKAPCSMFQDGTPLSRRTLASNLHILLELCGLQPNNYNTHSFRIGAATTAAAAGLPAWLIKILGRWRSDSYERYIHLPQATILQVPTTMVAYHQNHTGVENLTTFDPCNLQSGVPIFFIRGGKVRLIQLLDYLSVASPESGLFSDWSRNKGYLEQNKISVSLACYWHIGSKSINYSH